MVKTEAQLIICEKSEFTKSHSIHNVINHIIVDAFPCVVDVAAFIKVIDLPAINTTDLDLVVFDSEGNLLNNFPTFALRNYRDQDQTPGVDLNLNVQLVILKSGIINFQLYLNKEKITFYPVTVRI